MADWCVDALIIISNNRLRPRAIRNVALWCPYSIYGDVTVDYNTHTANGSGIGSVVDEGGGVWKFTTPPGVIEFDVLVFAAGGGGSPGSGGRGGDLFNASEGGKGGNGGNGGGVSVETFYPAPGQIYYINIGVGGLAGVGGFGGHDDEDCPNEGGMVSGTAGGNSDFGGTTSVGGAPGTMNWGCSSGGDFNPANPSTGGAMGGRGNEGSTGENGLNNSYSTGGIGSQGTTRDGGGAGGGGAGHMAGGNASSGSSTAGNGGPGAGGGGGGGGHGGDYGSDGGAGGNSGAGGNGRVIIDMSRTYTPTTQDTWC